MAITTRRLLAQALPLCLLTTGCVMGPDYKRPDVALPTAYEAAATNAIDSAAPATRDAALLDTRWWQAFGDPQLDKLIRIALKENKDLRIAADRIAQFNANLQVTEAAGWPQAEFGAGRTRDTLSQNAQAPLNPGTPVTANNYRVIGAVYWEIDFWGRIARSNEAAVADLLATEEGRNVLVLTLVADVASSYVRMLALDGELDIRRRTADSLRESLRLLEAKFSGGGISEIPVSKARAELESALAELQLLEGQIVVIEHSLSLLLGRNPGRIERGKRLGELVLPAIPSGLPAKLLRQRPDLRKAEQDLVAANARIGVAETQYLPTISLTMQEGFASTQLSDLLMKSSNFATFGVALLGPLFTSGRIAGQVREVEAVQRQRETEWLRAVQAALRDVEDALSTAAKTRQEVAGRSRQLRALQALSDVAHKREQGGAASFIEVLEFERDLHRGELQSNQSLRNQYLALIGVYKAMGGGWSVTDVVAVAPSTTQAINE